MTKVLFVTLPLLIFLSGLSLQAQNRIQWEEEVKLTWKDSKGKPMPTNHKVAATNYEIGYKYWMENNEFKFKVTCEFVKDLSWVAPIGKSDYILKHEQKHFDLAEVYARKLRKAFNEGDITIKNYKRQIKSIYNQIWEECQAAQAQYDDESHHSIDTRAQEKWDLLIDAQLEQFEAYKKDL